MLSIITPCYNEEDNLSELIRRVRASAQEIGIPYEHIIIDNASTDRSQSIIRAACAEDPRVRAIFNLTNAGHIKSPYYGLLQTTGHCSILIPSDLQAPPELIPVLFERWKQGAQVVLLVRTGSEERGPRQWARRLYYRLLQIASSSPVVPGATGDGIYDRSVVDYMQTLTEPYPYLRGLVAEAGFAVETLGFEQPLRKAGRSKNNWATLYDLAMLGLTTSSRMPLRLVSLVGYLVALGSLFVAGIYLARKILDWDAFELGLAPLATGLFFLGAIQLISIGIIGEYVGNIFMRLRNLPLVIEQERINFGCEETKP